jgi:hypothetical protein
MLKKRGQITVFIIIGLIIIISVGLFIHLRSSTVNEKSIIQRNTPIQNYVETCLEEVATDATRLIASRGGYIDLPTHMKYNPFKSLNFGPLGINSSQRVAMWHSEGNSKDLIPSIGYIEVQVNNYIETYLPKCLNNFEGLKEARVVESGEIESKFRISSEDITAEIKYPLTIINLKNDKITKVNKFIKTIPIRFQKVYDLAIEILKAENNQPFIERKVIDLIALDEDIPINGFEISCMKKNWLIPDLKNKMKDLLMVNLPFIKLIGTDYTMPNSPYIYNHYQWEFSEKAAKNPKLYKDIGVSINYYPNWWMDFTAKPNRGGLLLESGSEHASKYLSWFCMQLWHFVYDVRFPVEIRIVDKATSKHKKLIFSFGTDVSVENNQPARPSTGISLSGPKTARESQEEFCNNVEHSVSIDLRNKEKPNLYAYGIKERDAVDLSFQCGRFSCDLGKAKDTGYGAGYGWEGKLPPCFAGTISVESDEFVEESFPISTYRSGSFSYMLNPLKQIKYIDTKIFRSDTPWDLRFRRLKPTETVMITLSLENSSYTTSSYGKIEGKGENANISLLMPFEMLGYKDYTYKTEVWLINSGEGSDFTKITGMYVGNWTVEWNKLKNANKIVFNVPEFMPKPKSEMDFFMYYLSINNISSYVPLPEVT